ncbi:MAG: hypothetical protein A2556_01325 [Candidatus Vogelbacteria bacterium RIFOXYD2_FULL_44_9]|uniref:Uncharacterized protein n=1 Tax=Candidatus Vogelbacteria bacterium RIFOXYD2_FULL_44_9 TaxID=1802441 RepID=A0A1G2QPA2_9BACT|nr:MAG: hypothetical protein A2556_01325 [Candidatus Vogelbacteria bacterium RIFOXYD2_FULL_44_9]
MSLVQSERTEPDRAGLCRYQGIDGRWGLCLPDGRSIVPPIYQQIDAFRHEGIEGWQTYQENDQPAVIITREYLANRRRDQTARECLLAIFSLQTSFWR